MIGRTGVRLLALTLAVASARYFLVPPPWLRPPVPAWATVLQGPVADAARSVAPYLYEYHAWLLLPHIGGGIVALLVGLVQFMGSLRDARPNLHRSVGFIYLTAVLISGATGLPLSLVTLDGIPAPMRPQFYPVVAAFASLSLTWPFVSAVAFVRAKQQRFDDHRAWMTRSYCLTFSAVTVRLAAPVLLVLTGSPVVAINGSIWTWPLNLFVAEGLIRAQRSGPARSSTPSALASTQ